jgi:hypothetical protein
MTQFPSSQYVENHTREEWEQRKEAAYKLMEERRNIPTVLIEVSSQHQLRQGLYPGEEYAARLDVGIELYHKAKKQGLKPTIEVLGSRHREGDIEDKRTLSIAGKEYLVERGIPAEDIHGDDLIERYKGPDHAWPGAYNSADEAYIASRYFIEENFGHLWTVIAPAQLHRKMLHYIWLGTMPLAYSAPLDHGYHDFVREAFDFIPFTIHEDPGHQEPGSRAAKSSRERRMPKQS